MPQETDISIWRGNNAPDVVWTLAAGIPDGADYFLTVAAGGTVILSRDTLAGSLGLDSELRELRWTLTLQESRAIPPGRVATYEIERRQDDTEATEIFGTITGRGGFNTDAGAPSGSTMLDGFDLENSQLLLMGWIA